jgi:UDP:flavonoid glycosyltransferase YjiC (YdhE family)
VKVVLLTAGSRGDVEPYVALGRGLRDEGFDVRVAAHPAFRVLVERHGLEFAEVSPRDPTLIGGSRWNAVQSDAATAAKYVGRWARLRRSVSSYADRVVADHWAACLGADAVVSSLSAIRGPQQAAELDVPHVWALLQPMSPTREYPQFMVASRLPGPINRRSHAVGEAVYRRLFRDTDGRWAPSRPGLFGAAGGPIVYGISPTVVPRPADWPPNVAQFGDWHLESSATDALPSEVEAFLESGPPPVFVHAARIAVPGFAAAAARALASLGRRALVSGWPQDEPLPAGVAAAPDVSFARLFTRVAAVVHHGGAGTVAAALRSGRPTLGIPGSFDQRFWSERIAALGAGARPLPARRVTPIRLERALEQLVGVRDYERRALELSGRLRRERGVGDTVAHLQSLFECEAVSGRVTSSSPYRMS